MQQQYDFFLPESITELQAKIEKCQKSSEQVRKGLFARHMAIEKYVTELCDRLQEQEKEIYKLKQAIHSDSEPLYIKAM